MAAIEKDKDEPTVVLPPHWCAVCALDLQSSASLQQHVLGRKHLRKAGTPLARPPMPLLTETVFFALLANGRYRNVVICTGAGVSTAAGIPDFRSPGGLFEAAALHFGPRFPEVAASPTQLLSRSWADANPKVFRDEVTPWLRQWKIEAAQPTPTHYFCAWLHQRGWLRRVYTQNIDGLHEKVIEGSPLLPHGHVVECHGSMLRGNIVMYGDNLPDEFEVRLCEDFGAASEREGGGVDLVMVFGTSLQVAPFCAIPNLAPRGASRVLVNRNLAHACSNSWSRAPRRCGLGLGLDAVEGMYAAKPPVTRTRKLAGRSVSLCPMWRENRVASQRWRQLLVEDDCDPFVKRFFASKAAEKMELTLTPLGRDIEEDRGAQ